MPIVAPCPPVAVVPQKQVVKPPAVAGPQDVEDDVAVVSGLENAEVAAQMNKFLLGLQTERAYVGTSAFLIFALRYRMRVCVCSMVRERKTYCPSMHRGPARLLLTKRYARLSAASSAVFGAWR